MNKRAIRKRNGAGRVLLLFTLSCISFSLFLPSTLAPEDDEYRIKQYHWEFKPGRGPAIQLNWELNISLERLNSYNDFPVEKRRNYGYMITTNEQTLIDAASSFRNTSEKENYSIYTVASLVLSFVQSLEYTSDKVTTGYDEYPRFPLETLDENGGDCEDTSILFATLMILLDYEAVLMMILDEEAGTGHMAVGIDMEGIDGYFVELEGKQYYYVETTGENWKIGEIPQEYKDSTIHILKFTGEQYDPDNPFDHDTESSFDIYFIPGVIIILTLALLLIYILLKTDFISTSSTEEEESGRTHEFVDDIIDEWTTFESREKMENSWMDESYYMGDKALDDELRGSNCMRCGASMKFDNIWEEWVCEKCESEKNEFYL